MSADRPIPREDVAALLAAALGQHKSEEILAAKAKELGLCSGSFGADEVHALFASLVKADGLVGVVARFAVSRGDVERLIPHSRAPQSARQPTGGPQVPIAATPAPGASRPPATAPATVTHPVDLMQLLAPALGAEKAREAIEEAAARRSVDVATGLSEAGALAVLDEMASVSGIVGVVARFAKARFLIEPGG